MQEAVERSLGPIRLADGVRRRHALSFITVSVASIGLIVFLNFMQPYLLTGQIADAAAGTLGRITGNLSVMQEIIVLLLVGPLGSLSDQVGRPAMFAAGLLLLSAALLALTAVTSVAGLTAVRILFACGAAAAAATLATVAADYPDNAARGKFLGVLLITQQLAVLFLVARGAAKLPGFLGAHGVGRIAAGQITFGSAGIFGLACAALAFFGLRQRGPASRREPVLRGLLDIAAYARRQPRFLIVLLVAFVARGDAAIMGSFLSLWAVRTATAGGATQMAAIATAGALLTAVTVASIASAALTGWVTDRLDRLIPLAAALLLAGAGNCSLLLVHDLGHWPVYALVGLIAGAETGIVVAGQSVLGEQAPPALRGAAIGVFSICGSAGVLILVFVGGILFDRVAPQAPFIMLGAVNLAAGCTALSLFSSGARHAAISP